MAKCINCKSTSCTKIYRGKCIQYTGTYLSALDISNGDSLDEILRKLNNYCYNKTTTTTTTTTTSTSTSTTTTSSTTSTTTSSTSTTSTTTSSTSSTSSTTTTTTSTGAPILAYFAIVNSDPYPTISGGSDPYSYDSGTVVPTLSSPITLDIPDTLNQWVIVKVDVSVSTKTNYQNGFENGVIPGPVWQSPVVIAGVTRYYVTRLDVTFDGSNSLILS